MLKERQVVDSNLRGSQFDGNMLIPRRQRHLHSVKVANAADHIPHWINLANSPQPPFALRAVGECGGKKVADSAAGPPHWMQAR
jgi:hypothetical protein